MLKIVNEQSYKNLKACFPVFVFVKTDATQEGYGRPLSRRLKIFLSLSPGKMKAFLRKNYAWILFLILVSLGSLFAESINHRFEMRDLEVYHKAAVRMLDGEGLYRDIEADPYEHYVYKYSPPAALLFTPFVLTGLAAGKYIYWALLTFIMGAVLYILPRDIVRNYIPSRHITWIIIPGIIITGTHFFAELHLGQVNLLLLGIYVWALLLFLKRNAAAPGILLAISIFIKPFGLIFLPLFLVLGRWKEMLWFLGSALLMFLLPLFFYPDIHEFLGLYRSWIHELLIELGNKQALFADGNHTLFSVLARQSPLHHILQTEIARLLYQLLLLSLIALFLLWYLFRKKHPEGKARIYIVLIAIIPLLAFTSSNAFIFTLPLILYLLAGFRKMSPVLKIIFILSCILIGGNIYDLLGKDTYEFFRDLSVYTWGSLGLMLCLFLNWKNTPGTSAGAS